MKVLVACEFSGAVRSAFRHRGHDAWSCDLDPAWDGSPHHIQGDVIPILEDGWDLIIAHPPCTYLSNSGSKWFYTTPNKCQSNTFFGEERIEACKRATEFFKLFLNSSCPRVCVENPLPHDRATQLIGKYTQRIHTNWFGHPENRSTCLWLRNLPNLKITNWVRPSGSGDVHQMYFHQYHKDPKKNKAYIQKLRSVTFAGVAKAMSEQWDAF